MKEKIEKLKEKIKAKPKLHKFLKLFRIICNIGAYLIALFTILSLSIGGACSNNEKKVLAYGDYKVHKNLNESNSYKYIGLGDLLYYLENNDITTLSPINDLAGVSSGNYITNNINLGYFSNYQLTTFLPFTRLAIYTNRDINYTYSTDFGSYYNNGSIDFSTRVSSTYSYELSINQYIKATTLDYYFVTYTLKSTRTSSTTGYSERINFLYASNDNIYFNKLYDIIEASQPSSDAIYTQDDLDSATSEAFDSGYSEGYDNGYNAGAEENGINTNITTETIIPSDYDFRKLVANDYYKDYGVFSVNGLNYNHGDVVAYSMAISGGSTWTIGDKTYNALILTIMSIDPNTTIYNSVEGTSATASSIFGDSYTNIFGMPYIQYAYFDSENYSSYVDNGWHLASDVNILGECDYKLKIIDNMDTTSNSINWNIYTWTSLGFRVLNDFESDNILVSVPLYDNVLTFKQLVTLDDNSVQSDNTAIVNVFTLVKQGFNALTGILGIYILPGMTLGVLMFIPLIATIIFAVIRIIKK